MKTMAFGKVGDCIININSTQSPSDEDWESYLSFLELNLRGMSTARILVITDGGAPSAAQRKKLTDTTKGKNGRVAVVTASVVARGVVTALGWFDPHAYKAFPPSDMDGALQHLGVATMYVADVKRLAASLQTKLRAISAA